MVAQDWWLNLLNTMWVKQLYLFILQLVNQFAIFVYQFATLVYHFGWYIGISMLVYFVFDGILVLQCWFIGVSMLISRIALHIGTLLIGHYIRSLGHY